MKNNIKLFCWFLLLYMFTLSGCGLFNKEEEKPEPDGSEYFVAATPISTIPKSVLQGLAQASGFGSSVNLLKYDVAFYKFTYKTTYKNSETEVSGLLAIPQNTPAPPALLSAQHGTMFADADAPSNFPAAFTGFELLASAGYITVIPDFIGYGVSKDIVHPYYDEQHSALTVVDMLKAAKYYLKKEKINLNSNLFLVGYSEGGYVTMAAQKEIEANPKHNLTLTAVAAGAGGYDLTGMLSGIATTTTYVEPSFLALIIQAYNTTYNWNRPFTDFFQEPYAGRIPTLLNGTMKREEINNQLTTSPSALFNPVFYANLLNPAGELALKQALTNNSLLDWVPKSPTRLYHGTADEAVFYQTSETTFNRFKAAGANNVELKPISGGMHRTSIIPMMLDALSWFDSQNK
ncbi:alpha/beta hydrolase family protein [Adhaeribacter aquaticus]|uniref:alpha/beta hydrolase family protein n=1 Tax=Adhaeribacter aquaticus TaxID=299567 RepID=UPI000A02F40D|nr:alpha/beta fold hydrolase [Adhaeribacter aquaticus]